MKSVYFLITIIYLTNLIDGMVLFDGEQQLVQNNVVFFHHEYPM